MPNGQQFLSTGAVSIQAPVQIPALSFVVGNPPQWDDRLSPTALDSYAQIGDRLTAGQSNPQTDRAQAPVQQLAGLTDPTLLDVTLGVQIAHDALPAGANNPTVTIWLNAFADGLFLAGQRYTTLSSTPTFYTYRASTTADQLGVARATHLRRILTALTASGGAQMTVQIVTDKQANGTNPQVTTTARIYVVAIIADYFTPDIVAYQPTRLFPRDDGTGLSSAPRIHPPPRRRVVGGQQ